MSDTTQVNLDDVITGMQNEIGRLAYEKAVLSARLISAEKIIAGLRERYDIDLQALRSQVETLRTGLLIEQKQHEELVAAYDELSGQYEVATTPKRRGPKPKAAATG